MKIARFKIDLDDAGRIAIDDTFSAYAAMQGILEDMHPKSRGNVVELNRIAYDPIRTATHLPSRMVQNGIREFAMGIFAANRLPLDDKLFAMKGVDRISFATLGDRIVSGCILEGYSDISERGSFSHLVREEGGYFFLAILSQSMQTKEIEPMHTESIQGRVSRLASGLVNSVIDVLENRSPDAVAEQAIREIDKALDELKTNLGAAMAEHKRYSMQRKAYTEENKSLTDNIRLAVKDGREDLARAGIERQDDLISMTNALDELISAVGHRITDSETAMRAAGAARREAIERVQTAKKAQAQEIASGRTTSRPSSAGPSVEDRIANALSAVQRATDLPTGKPRNTLLDDLEAHGRDKRIEDRLASIRNEIDSQG